MMSMNHCMPISSAHMSAEAVSTPGMHVQPLVPSRSTVSVPSAPISTTFAPSRIAGGPDFSARAMRYSVMTSDMRVLSLVESGCPLLSLTDVVCRSGPGIHHWLLLDCDH